MVAPRACWVEQPAYWVNKELHIYNPLVVFIWKGKPHLSAVCLVGGGVGTGDWARWGGGGGHGNWYYATYFILDYTTVTKNGVKIPPYVLQVLIVRHCMFTSQCFVLELLFIGYFLMKDYLLRLDVGVCWFGLGLDLEGCLAHGGWKFRFRPHVST